MDIQLLIVLLFFHCRLGDEGIQPVLKALMKNLTLISLDISSNDFGEPSASLMSEVNPSILDNAIFHAYM